MWFFVNLAVLFVAGWLLVRGQFQVSGFSARVAGDRVQNKALEIMAELNTAPSEKWDAILAKNAAPFGVKLHLYDNGGRHLAGPKQPLLPEVHNRLVGARPHYAWRINAVVRRVMNAVRPAPRIARFAREILIHSAGRPMVRAMDLRAHCRASNNANCRTSCSFIPQTLTATGCW